MIIGPERHAVAANDRVDWTASIRLAMYASSIAGLAAVTLSPWVPGPTIITSVFVASLAASWFQLDHPRRTPPKS